VSAADGAGRDEKMISPRPASGSGQQWLPAVAVSDAVGPEPDLIVPRPGKRLSASQFGAIHHDAQVFAGPPPSAGARLVALPLREGDSSGSGWVTPALSASRSREADMARSLASGGFPRG
jgi:hypothetical protein